MAPDSASSQGRKEAVRDGFVRLVVSVGLLAGGWVLPGIYISRDPIMRADPDLRTGPGIFLSFVIGAIYGAMALRSFARAFTTPAPRSP